MTTPTSNRTMIVITIMLVATLEVLDSTIVNVALPNMMGTLGANSNQITWVLTSYVVASAIFMPLTGFLVDRLGRKRLLIINITGFMLASMLCGISTSLEEIVIFRLAQGAFGAALIPLSQAILRDTFPAEQQGKAMAIWGIGIMTAPVLGPTLGGYILEHAQWRWLFYLNLPVCTISLVLALFVIKETTRFKRKIDWFGLMLMAVGIGALQLFLDQGNEHSWFTSNYILVLFILSIVSLSYFIIRGIKNPNNIINLQIFRDKDFSISTLVLTIFAAGIFAVIATQPLMLQTLMHYPTVTSGLVMMPRGIASAMAMAVSPLLMRKLGSRVTLFIGVVITIYGTFMMSQVDLQANLSSLTWPGVVQGFGMGLFFVPLSANAFISLNEKFTSEAAGLFSYGRMVGTSIGISTLSTIITRETQINWNRFTEHLQATNPNLQHWLEVQGLNVHSPEALHLLAQQVTEQSQMVAFIDGYWAIAIAMIVMLPLVLLLKNTRSAKLDAH